MRAGLYSYQASAGRVESELQLSNGNVQSSCSFLNSILVGGVEYRLLPVVLNLPVISIRVILQVERRLAQLARLGEQF
jgi:hypothetical protein